MCENCEDIILRDSFYSPTDYMNCLKYIQELIEAGRFALINKSCDLDKVINENGRWDSDVIEHTIQCKNCGKQFSCIGETYHGGGSFK